MTREYVIMSQQPSGYGRRRATDAQCELNVCCVYLYTYALPGAYHYRNDNRVNNNNSENKYK